MTSRTENARKRKQTTTIPEVVVSSDNHHSKSESKNKARRVSTSASVPTPATQQTAEVASIAITASNENGESINSIGKTIHELFRSDNAKVNAALAALNLNLIEDKKKCDKIQAVGGCLALVLLLKKCLDKVVDSISACDEVTVLTELADLTTLNKTLIVIINLTLQHAESQIGITAIGCVEVVVKVMKTFPKCQILQECACLVLVNLAYDSATGKQNIIESGGIEALLAAIDNHLDSPIVCEKSCWALVNSTIGSKESTELLISLGGATAVAKVRRKWPDEEKVQTHVRCLNNLIVAEMKSWG
jgi:hypothetical protein